MSASKAPLISPFLLLDASTWEIIGRFLGSGDAARLSLTNPRLSERIKRGIRDFKVEWQISRFIELNRVTDLISTYPNLKKAVFAQRKCFIRCWLPTTWNLTHSTLKELYLCFRAAPSLVLSPDATIGSSLPNLELLDIESVRSFQSAPPWIQHPEVSLLGLPSSLLCLRVRDSRTLRLNLEHFEQLPSGLEDLELDFAPDFAREEEDLPAFLLPRLPRSLKKLKLADGHLYWHIRAADLPASLESLELRSLKRGASFLEPEPTSNMTIERSLFDFHDSATRLPNLKRFIAARTLVWPDQALANVPPSVTQLSLLTAPSPYIPYDHLEQVVSQLGPKFIQYSIGQWQQLDHALLGNPASPPAEDAEPLMPLNIEEIFDFSTHTSASILRLPSKATSVSLRYPLNSAAPLTNGSDSWLPQSVTKLTINGIDRSPPTLDSFISPTYHHRLTELYLPKTWTFLEIDWFKALPDSLERLSAYIENDSWTELMTLMATSTRLPKVSYIFNSKTMDISTAFPIIPPQVKHLVTGVYITPGRFETLTEATFEPLLTSTLQDLRIIVTSTCDETELEKVILFLLNRLPKMLKFLGLRSHCTPSPKWSWNAPKGIQGIEFSAIIPAKPDVSAEEGKKVKTDDGALNISLPDSLAFLLLKNPDDFPEECLPPYLSSICPGSQAEKSYLTSRQPPFPGASLLIDPRERT